MTSRKRATYPSNAGWSPTSLASFRLQVPNRRTWTPRGAADRQRCACQTGNRKNPAPSPSQRTDTGVHGRQHRRVRTVPGTAGASHHLRHSSARARGGPFTLPKRRCTGDRVGPRPVGSPRVGFGSSESFLRKPFAHACALGRNKRGHRRTRGKNRRCPGRQPATARRNCRQGRCCRIADTWTRRNCSGCWIHFAPKLRHDRLTLARRRGAAIQRHPERDLVAWQGHRTPPLS